MYLAVDIGATKTLVACFDGHGKLLNAVKFATPGDYEAWLEHCKAALSELKCDDFKAGCVAFAGKLDKDRGVALYFGNLAWEDVSLASDLERLAQCPILLENDAKAASLYEASQLKDKYEKILYITIGTGIGLALVTDGEIDDAIGYSGGRYVMLEHHGKLRSWEEFASGKAIVKRFGKKASEITDEKTWKVIAHDFAQGILDLNAVIEPDLIIIGGGVGSNFNRFGKLLESELKKYETPMVPIPPIKAANKPEEAVIYGCYSIIKDHYAHTHSQA